MQKHKNRKRKTTVAAAGKARSLSPSVSLPHAVTYEMPETRSGVQQRRV